MRFGLRRVVIAILIVMLGSTSLLAPVHAAPEVDSAWVLQSKQDKQAAKEAAKNEARIKKVNATAEKSWRECVAYHGACIRMQVVLIAATQCHVTLWYENSNPELFPVVYWQEVDVRFASGGVKVSSHQETHSEDGQTVIMLFSTIIDKGEYITGQAFRERTPSGAPVPLGSHAFTC